MLTPDQVRYLLRLLDEQWRYVETRKTYGDMDALDEQLKIEGIQEKLSVGGGGVSLLERIICHGNRTLNVERIKAGVGRSENHIKCVDGFNLSVIAGEGTYCTPRPGMPPLGDVPEGYSGPYTAVEVGFPSERPEPWNEWAEYAETPGEPTETVYGYVPVDLVRALVEAHGGEV